MPMLERFLLTDRVAIVTGAGKGIGAAIAIAFAEAGSDVALLARTVADLDTVAARVRERGRRALVVPTDISELDQLSPAVDRTVAELGGCRHLGQQRRRRGAGAVHEHPPEAHGAGVSFQRLL